MSSKRNHSENSINNDEDEEMPMPMPVSTKKKKRRTLQHEKIYLENLPCADMYEKSYMHRDIMTQVLVTPITQFIVTASIDGHIKFWKKMSKGIEFVKHYKAHLKRILDLQCSHDGLRLCSISEDQTIKFYDVLSFDMINIISVQYVPSCCIWIHQKSNGLQCVAIGDKESNWIRIYRYEGEQEPLSILKDHHTAPVCTMAYNPHLYTVISGDTKGILTYWNTETLKLPTKQQGINFEFKSETDLFTLAKAKTQPTCIALNPQGTSFAVTCLDQQIRIFRFKTGKLRRTYNESPIVFEDAHADNTLGLEELDFGRRLAVERELISNKKNLSLSNCTFDETGHFLLYATCIGIKLINIETNALIKILGKVENTERFLNLALFQGIPTISSQIRSTSELIKESVQASTAEENNQSKKVDPILFTTSFKRQRFYLFSRREPEEFHEEENELETSIGRDVYNEKPMREDANMEMEQNQKHARNHGTNAIIHTTVGDIYIKLFPEDCPKTIENFCTHARNGYYNRVIFHRVIKNFMVQTGDPLGNGTGGESIWGGEFEDEIVRHLRHDRPFTVSMANGGPNTNGSQFFITTVPTPWLDGKHTVFGRVEKGMDVVSEIEQMKVDKVDRPLEVVQIINVTII